MDIKHTDISNHPVIALTQALIARASISPDDQGCQEILASRLQRLGFHIEYFPAGEGKNQVKNLWARLGHKKPLFCFAGHTDVVPPGPLPSWNSDPFQAEIREDHLYGRGAADMKSSVAAMVVAAEQLFADADTVRQFTNQGSMALLITSDEEGEATAGTRYAMECLTQRQEHIDWCLVGEPSSVTQLGDTIKNGRRGSMTAVLRITGKQGHVAYPHLAINPIHQVAPFLQELSTRRWDQGNLYYPPSSLQIVDINSGVGAYNVIPGVCTIVFNIRFSTEQTTAGIQQKVQQLLEAHGLDYQIDWKINGLPFLTQPGQLTQAVHEAIQEYSGIVPTLSTSGGTSDGRFIAPTGAQVVEFGVINQTIHQPNECVRLQDVVDLTHIYQQIVRKLFHLPSDI